MKRQHNNTINTKKYPDDDSSDDEFEDRTKKIKLSFSEHKIKYDEVNREIINRVITMNEVFKLNLKMDENIWFLEHLRILNTIDENTEDYYRMKTIIYNKYMNLKNINLNELEKVKIASNSEHDIVNRILNSTHPDSVKAILYRKYKRCCDNYLEAGHSDEMFKIVEWIDNILDIPTQIKESDVSINDKLVKLWKRLNENISGLQHVKEKVMEAMCAKLINPQNKGKVLTFVGPPGVGKTAIATSIAESLEMPFDQISFGSIKDPATLTGHSSTYVGAIPGLF